MSVRYFDHHFAGEIPAHPGLEAHIDLSPNVCTSLLVDRHLDGRCRRWAIVGAYGDSMTAEARRARGRGGARARRGGSGSRRSGIAINYNAYGETIADLHVPPVELAAEMLPFARPAGVRGRVGRVQTTGGRDAETTWSSRNGSSPARQAPGAVVFMLPDAAWARRASGTLANDKAKAHAGSAVAIVSPKTDGRLSGFRARSARFLRLGGGVLS